VSFAVEGLAVGVYGTTWEIARQRAIPDELQSRVSAWDWMGSLAGMPIGLLLAGPALVLLGTRATLYAMAACGFALSSSLLLSRDVRGVGVPVAEPA